ncbi:hypothetical protein WKK05_40555 (plasmid) [Nostoc sp. UHCC 0302]
MGIAPVTNTNDNKDLPTLSRRVVNGAIDGSRIVTSAFDKDWDLLASGNNSVYRAIVNVSMLGAVVFVSFWALQWYEQFMEEGFSPGFVREVAFPLIVILLLSNNGAMLAASSLALRNVSNNLNSQVLSITRGDVSLKNAIRGANIDQSFILAAQAQLSQCEKLQEKATDPNGLETYPKQECQQKIVKDAEDQANSYKQEKGIQAKSKWNILDIIGGVINYIVQGMSYIIFSGLSAAFQFVVQFSFLLTAYMAPIFLVLSILPLGAKPIFAWLSGWLALALIMMSNSILVGVAASAFVETPTNNPMLLQLIQAIFSPILSVAMGAGGGMALFTGFTSAAKFTISPRR